MCVGSTIPFITFTLMLKFFLNYNRKNGLTIKLDVRGNIIKLIKGIHKWKW